MQLDELNEFGFQRDSLGASVAMAALDSDDRAQVAAARAQMHAHPDEQHQQSDRHQNVAQAHNVLGQQRNYEADRLARIIR